MTGFEAGVIVIHCPICGWPVELPVQVSSISPYVLGKGKVGLRVSLRDSETDNHDCGPVPGDGRSVLERFITDGHLDDPTLPERT
jgi:hypothetical protein